MTGYPLGTPVGQLRWQTGNPASTKNPDLSFPNAMGGRNGELLTRPLGGKRLLPALKGNCFWAGTLVAGVTPVPWAAGTTLVTTFGLINPLGSSKIIEVHAIYLANITHPFTDTALNTIGVGIQINASQVAVPSGITKLNPIATPMGGAGLSAAGIAYSAATLHFASTHEVYDVILYPWDTAQTGVGGAGQMTGKATFDGDLLLYPDSNLSAFENEAGGTGDPTVLMTVCWSEWPL